MQHNQDILQAWYANDSSFGGMALVIAAAMHTILEKGPARGYFPKPSKLILICNPAMQDAVQGELGKLYFQCKDGYCHIGGFIRTEEMKAQWL